MGRADRGNAGGKCPAARTVRWRLRRVGRRRRRHDGHHGGACRARRPGFSQRHASRSDRAAARRDTPRRDASGGSDAAGVSGTIRPAAGSSREHVGDARGRRWARTCPVRGRVLQRAGERLFGVVFRQRRRHSRHPVARPADRRARVKRYRQCHGDGFRPGRHCHPDVHCPGGDGLRPDPVRGCGRCSTRTGAAGRPAAGSSARCSCRTEVLPPVGCPSRSDPTAPPPDDATEDSVPVEALPPAPSRRRRRCRAACPTVGDRGAVQDGGRQFLLRRGGPRLGGGVLRSHERPGVDDRCRSGDLRGWCDPELPLSR